MFNSNIPRNVLEYKKKENLADSLTDIKVKGTKTITAKFQKEIYEKTLESPLSSNYLYVISSTETAFKAQRFAHSIFKLALQDHYKHHMTDNIDPPYWHNIYGGYRDELRDDPSFRSKVGKPILLVISDLYPDSSDLRIEKARDLLNIHHNSSRILILCNNTEPLSFVREKLYISVNRFAYLSSTRHVSL